MKEYWARSGRETANFFLWAWQNHPGKLIGISLGFILGLLVVVMGFWKTLVLVLFVAAGYVLGKREDDFQSLSLWLDRLIGK
ncbi:MAG TPA: DUF2273 domain-containing protein [Desulfitobacteriaceae bacterium]|nr:DUF2273 domain-containing protein [Desulfitobacteriaceae bacterium]